MSNDSRFLAFKAAQHAADTGFELSRYELGDPMTDTDWDEWAEREGVVYQPKRTACTVISLAVNLARYSTYKRLCRNFMVFMDDKLWEIVNRVKAWFTGYVEEDIEDYLQRRASFQRIMATDFDALEAMKQLTIDGVQVELWYSEDDDEWIADTLYGFQGIGRTVNEAIAWVVAEEG